MQIFVVAVSGREVSRLNIESSTKVLEVQQLLVSVAGVPCARVRLLHDGTQLATHVTMADASIKHESVLTMVVLGPRILTGSADYTTKIWHADTGELVDTFAIHSAPVHCTVVSADSLLVATACGDANAGIWHAENGSSVHTLSHDDGVISAAFSADGAFLATACFDDVARLWRVETGQCEACVACKEGVNSVASSKDGNFVMLAAGYEARMWDTRTGYIRRRFRHRRMVKAVVLSADDSVLATASSDTTAGLWCVHTGKGLQTLRGHDDDVNSVAFSADGCYLLTASHDHTFKRWEVQSGKCTQTFTGHSSNVYSALFSADGSMVLSACRDRTAKLWSAERGQCLQTFTGHSDAVNSAVFM